MSNGVEKLYYGLHFFWWFYQLPHTGPFSYLVSNMLLTPVFALLLVKFTFATPQGGWSLNQQPMVQAQHGQDEPQGFDIYKGPLTQVKHDYDAPEDLTYTLTGGQPYVLSELRPPRA